MTVVARHRCRLTFVLGGRAEESVLQGPRVVVGRSSQCDLTLADESVSRQHAELVEVPAGWVVRDLDSRNGIAVNGRPVTEQLLRDGDSLRIGGVAMRCAITFEGPETPGVIFEDTSIEGALRHVIDLDRMGPLMDGTTCLPGSLAPAAEGASPSRRHGSLEQGLWIAAPLREAAEALLCGTELADVLDQFLQIVARHLRAQRGFIGLRDEKSGELVPRATWSRLKEDAGPIRISRSIADAAMNAHQSILVGDVADDTRFREADSIVQQDIRSAMCAPLMRNGQVGGLIYVDTLNVVEPFQRDSLEVLSILATLAAIAVDATNLRDQAAREQRIREKLARYSSASVVRCIIDRQRGADSGDLGSTECDVSVLFCDFAGFTSFAESLAPADVTRVLNHAFERLTAAVFAEEGTLDKFTGDGMMVFFGAPIPQPDHADRAVRTALRMQRALAEPACDDRSLPPLALRIGINSGPAIVGDVGTPSRSDYTAIGATVNTASRLESTVAKPGQIVIGPATHARLGDRFRCVELEEQLLRGMRRPIRPFLVLGESS